MLVATQQNPGKVAVVTTCARDSEDSILKESFLLLACGTVFSLFVFAMELLRNRIHQRIERAAVEKITGGYCE